MGSAGSPPEMLSPAAPHEGESERLLGSAATGGPSQ
jgi:hypothetical protein